MLTALSVIKKATVLVLFFFTFNATAAELIDIDYNAENDFLPYKYLVKTAKESGSDLPFIVKRDHVISRFRKPGDTAIFLHVYNPRISSGMPAIFSYQNFTANKVVDDNPVNMIIKDSEYYIDSTDHEGRTIAVGYYKDTAYIIQNKYIEPHFDKKRLYAGVDGNGDGKWLPQLEIILVSDYDYDGIQEAFVYLNSIREKTPRILYCIELPSLEIEWELPVAPLLSRKYIYDCKDSTNPSILFVSYNPKQGASDDNFSDLYAYLTKVDNKGQIIFNHIISEEYGTMNLHHDDGDSLYYVSHSIPFTAQDDTVNFPQSVYTLSAIDKNGKIIYETTYDNLFRNVWSADYDRDGIKEIYALSSNRHIQIYNRQLKLLYYTKETNIGGWGTLTRLPYYDQDVLVFSTQSSQQDLYSPQLDKLAIADPGFSFFDPIVYDENGEVAIYLTHGGDHNYFIQYYKRSFIDFIKIAFWKYEKYVLALLIALIIVILVINQLRIKSLKRYKETNTEYLTLLTHIPIGIYRSTPEGELLSANKSMLDICGFDSFEAMKTAGTHAAYLKRSDRDDFMEQLKKEKIIIDQQFQLQKKDGTRIWVSTSAYGNFDENGRMTYFDGIDVEITDRKTTELALVESESRFKGIVEDALVGIFLIEDYKLKYTNTEMENITGYSFEESIDTDPMGYVHPDDRMIAKAHLREIMEGVVENHTITLRFLTKLNNIRVVDIYATNIIVQSKKMVVGTILDVTDKREAEEALKYSEEFNRTVLAHSPLGISVRSKTGQLLSVNKAWMDIWCHTQEEVDELLKRKRDTLNFDDSDRYLGEWQAKVLDIYQKGGYLHVPEVNLLKKKNKDRWVSQYFYAVKNDHEQVERVVIMTEDITSRKQAETKMLTSQAQLESTLESTNDYIMLCDKNGDVVYFNTAFKQIMKTLFNIEMRTGMKPHTNIENKERRKEREEIYLRALRGEQFSTEFSYVRPDGELMFFEQYYNPIYEGKQVIGFSEFTHNITERKEAENKILTSQAQLSSLLESTVDYIVLCDLDGVPIYFNSAFAAIMKEVYGYDIIPGDKKYKYPGFEPDHERFDLFMHNLDRVLKGEQFSVESNLKMPDGRTMFLEHYYNPIFDGAKIIGFSEFTHNITERKEYALQIEINYKYQTVLNDLLEIGLERLPQNEHLSKFLKTLTGAPFLPLKAQGAIFIVNEEGALSLVSSLNLPDSLKKSCAIVNFGKCLCGKAAESKKLIYMPAVNDLHEIHYDGIEPHGHYCVPILSKDKLLGVINLYLEENHEYNLLEEDFLTAAASTLAGILERQKIEERLHLMISAIEQSKEGLAVVDLEGNIKFVNHSFANMHGYTPEELYGKSLEIFHNEEQIADVIRANVQIQEEGDFVGEIGHMRRDGSVFPAMMHNSLLYDEDNRPIGMIGTLRDISDLKKSQLALEESEEKFRSLAELTSTGIFIYKDNDLVYANPMAVTITGYTREELNIITIWATIAPEYRAMAYERGLARLRGEDVEPTYEIEIICKSGERKWILYSGIAIDYEGELAVLGTFFDITENKRTAEKIKQIERERYNQTKEIAGGVAHEIYNSLFPATSSLDKLKQRLEMNDQKDLERNQKLINLAETAIWRALSMTETVTQFSRLDSRKDIEIIIIKEFIDELIQSNNEYILKNVNFEFDIDPSATLKINRNHLFSLINNIIGNAVDALSEVENKTIKIQVKLVNGNVIISIKDNGPGIPYEIVEKVFDPFFSTKPRTGTGLGLAICKKIVDIYDGQLTLESHLDEGSNFVILLKAP